MDSLTLFGLFAVTAMLVFYALEDRSNWFILAFAAERHHLHGGVTHLSEEAIDH